MLFLKIFSMEVCVCVCVCVCVRVCVDKRKIFTLMWIGMMRKLRTLPNTCQARFFFCFISQKYTGKIVYLQLKRFL